ncbi:n6 adenosine methyltransferase 70 kDa [Echinococcus multilocularis]|uniref:mRNA m(6)A methyltransferase n=1 Tax=Echinococcus multilocularis TaxID=6211 RepID=A0A0S4MME3_ECHMU|nr:n6 adenosine methyltransferase 70 kDa [Echinococcus multilocularis]
MIIFDKFAVIMADPPWDLHMKLPHGAMSDDEMRETDTPCLQDDEYTFLWVTGRYLMQEASRLTLAMLFYVFHSSIASYCKVTLGDQLDCTRPVDIEVVERYRRCYPNGTDKKADAS